MLDSFAQPLIRKPVQWLARRASHLGVQANTVTLLALLFGLTGALFASIGWFFPALICVLINRLGDGIDGTIALNQNVRASAESLARSKALGGYLDITSDFIFYGALPVGFCVVDPQNHALPTVFLLWSYLMTGTSFLAHAIAQNHHPGGEKSVARKSKSFFYSFGLIEGTETILFCFTICLFPEWYAPIAWIMAIACFFTSIHRNFRVIGAYRNSSS